MNGADRDIRLQIMLQPRELEVIEEWRFSKRMPSRAAAVRELIRRGLQADGFLVAPVGKPSAAYGAAETPQAGSKASKR